MGGEARGRRCVGRWVPLEGRSSPLLHEGACSVRGGAEDFELVKGHWAPGLDAELGDPPASFAGPGWPAWGAPPSRPPP